MLWLYVSDFSSFVSEPLMSAALEVEPEIAWKHEHNQVQRKNELTKHWDH